MRRLHVPLITSLACLGAVGAQAATFTIQKVYTSIDSTAGELPYAPHVGEEYRIAVTYTQSGVTVPYDIQFNVGGFKPTVNGVQVYPTVHVTDLSNGTKTVAYNAPGDLDDSVETVVTIDPGKPDAKTQSMTFKPTPPDNFVDFYNSHEVSGVQENVYTVENGANPYGMVFMTSIPCTDGWQKLLSNRTTVSLGPGKTYQLEEVHNDGAWPNPLNYWVGRDLTEKTVRFIQEFKLQLSSQRVNPDKLRTVTWADVDALQGINEFKHFTAPEAVIESSGPVITGFVHQILGADYRKHYTPYDAARKLFIAVAARCRYTFPENGKPDQRAKTAAAMCQTGLGDCGSYAMFLTAVWRNIGLPSRTCVGAWLGKDAGHCWSDVWFPHGGWIVGDACANSCNTDHRTAWWFGAVSDLTNRYAQERGNTFEFHGAKAEWLQGPMWPITKPVVSLKSSGFTVLSNYTPPPKQNNKTTMIVPNSMAKFDASTIAIKRN